MGYTDYCINKKIIVIPHHTLFTGGTLFTSEYCPHAETLFTGGELFTSEYCPGGHYSPVNSVRGDTSWGDSVHYDTGRWLIGMGFLKIIIMPSIIFITTFTHFR